MKNTEIKNLIDIYFDGELPKEKEPIMFSSISGDDELRNYFKSQNLLKNTFHQTTEEFPAELEERILRSAAASEKRKFFHPNFFTAMSYAAAAVLLIISIVLFSQTDNYKEQLDAKNLQINKQEQTIHLLLNSLPTAEVETVSANEIIIHENM